MILEVASLEIKEGKEHDFEEAMGSAALWLCQADGYLSYSLQRCLEDARRYLLFISWLTLEDHTIGFRSAPGHDRWKEALDPFYASKPVVKHYAQASPHAGQE